MKARALIRNAQVSPQKGRLVADMVRGLAVDRALDALAFSPKKAAAILRKALNSAISNAENNQNADVDRLQVMSVQVGDGMRLKRFRARAKGRAGRYIRRRSNIEIVVGYTEEGKA